MEPKELKVVHVLSGGYAVCCTLPDVPGTWPEGHFWVREEEWTVLLDNKCSECDKYTQAKWTLSRMTPGTFAALMESWEDRCRRLVDTKNQAYNERNRLVAYLATVYPSYLIRHPEEDTEWEHDWRWIVVVQATPEHQMTWHIHDSELPLFDHVRRYGVAWDGHTTEEKYRRLDELVKRRTERARTDASTRAGIYRDQVTDTGQPDGSVPPHAAGLPPDDVPGGDS